MTPERIKRLTDVLDKRQPALTIVLENVSDPHNISAVMRTCDAVGIQEIFILNTQIGLHKTWSAKTSSSAAKWLTVHQFTDAKSCFEMLRKNFNKIYSTHLEKDAVGLYDLNLIEKVALVFGNEHSGVSEEVISLCDGNFHIPQVGIIKSLNISVACAVSVYEAFRQKNIAGHYNQPQLNTEAMQLLSEQWGLLNAE